MIENKKLKNLLSKVPSAPGIYKMKDEEGKILYIGKAKDLKKRVKQYFKKGYEHSTRTKKLLEKVKDMDWTAVDSELEAFILEHNLIKQFMPKYNVVMKDDKNFVYIKIHKNEDFPRIQIVRKVLKDGAKYIGPKSAANKVQETFKVLKKLFPFRHCGLDIELIKENPKGDSEVKVTNKVLKYPCLDYFIKRCCAPCIGKCTKEEYRNIIKSVESFL
ncbi:MAG: GIY-YIG nuclease family protein, partial [Candidatus Gracilibacteria bacterium]